MLFNEGLKSKGGNLIIYSTYWTLFNIQALNTIRAKLVLAFPFANHWIIDSLQADFAEVNNFREVGILTLCISIGLFQGVRLNTVGFPHA